MLRKANRYDVIRLAKIHLYEFVSDFLPSLGEKFLSLLYLNLLQSKDTYIWVVQLNNKVQGFVVGSKDFSIVFKQIIVKNFVQYAFLILPQVIKKPNIVKGILETLFYTKKVNRNTPEAELIVIAVLRRYRRRGLGRQLVLALERNFKGENVKNYKLSVNVKNLAANVFYKSLGFNKKCDFFLYGKKINLYTKQIK